MARLAPAPKGNTRAVKHGASSELSLAPVRAKHAVVLKERYERIDEVRLALLANLFARIELATTWLDAQPGIVRNKNGEPFHIVRDLHLWERRAERIVNELDQEYRQPLKADRHRQCPARRTPYSCSRRRTRACEPASCTPSASETWTCCAASCAWTAR